MILNCSLPHLYLMSRVLMVRRTGETPGYEGLHGVAGLGVGHCVHSCLLVYLLLAVHGAPLPALSHNRGRGGGGRGWHVGDLHSLAAGLVG